MVVGNLLGLVAKHVNLIDYGVRNFVTSNSAKDSHTSSVFRFCVCLWYTGELPQVCVHGVALLEQMNNLFTPCLFHRG